MQHEWECTELAEQIELEHTESAEPLVQEQFELVELVEMEHSKQAVLEASVGLVPVGVYM